MKQQKLASVTESHVPDPSTNETSLETVLIKIRKKRSLFNKYLHFDVQQETPQLNCHLFHNVARLRAFALSSEDEQNLRAACVVSIIRTDKLLMFMVAFAFD
ncbi:hypothetical protein CEXT_112121 [Caerostris extrusa]|uniref:Uncharacterized protein n=1 Tax=Caerostris extrusa TaxID=172846 RepID=A0AAV4SVF3_CAEEX|nr:hypothetical protein CEXT_112121 [Caerostris extrusa]